MQYQRNRSSFSLTFFLGILAITNLAIAANDSVFDDDNRVEMTGNNYPWSTIGKLYMGGYSCTGTLIGRNLVLTAAHCIVDEKTGKIYDTPIEFYPNMVNGKAKTSSYAIYATYGGAYPTYDYADWAILELQDPLGDQYGYMGVQDKIDTLPFLVHSVGYSGDFDQGLTAGVHLGCSIHEANYLYNHDCDQTGGSSGGPMFIVKENHYYIVAIMVSEHRARKEDLNEKNQYPYSSSHSNHAVRAEFFQKYVAPLRKKIEEKPIT